MLRWWSWYILLISQFYSVQSRSIIDDSCTAKSHAVISKHCILKCVQLLYDNKFCTICVNGAVDMSTNIAEEEETLVDKRKLEWCTACVNDQWQRNSVYYDLLRNITNFFNDLEVDWCNDALNLNEYHGMKELHRTKRYNPGIGGAHARPDRPSYSMTYSETSMMVGMIIFGIFLLCAFGWFCKTLAKNFDPQESYQVNS